MSNKSGSFKLAIGLTLEPRETRKIVRNYCKMIQAVISSYDGDNCRKILSIRVHMLRPKLGGNVILRLKQEDVFCTCFVQDCAVLHTFPILVNIHMPIIWYSISIQFPLKISRISISASLTWRWEKQSVRVKVLKFDPWGILSMASRKNIGHIAIYVWISIKISVTLFPRVQLTIFQHLFR